MTVQVVSERSDPAEQHAFYAVLTEADYVYIIGAYLERREVAERAGREYELAEFVRDAMLSASAT